MRCVPRSSSTYTLSTRMILPITIVLPSAPPCHSTPFLLPQVRKALESFLSCPGVANQAHGTCGCDGYQHAVRLSDIWEMLHAQNPEACKEIGKKFETGLAPLVSRCLGQNVQIMQRHLNGSHGKFANLIYGVSDHARTLVDT